LLAFLLIFTIDKISLKFLGILLIYILQPDFNFRKNLKKIPSFTCLLWAGAGKIPAAQQRFQQGAYRQLPAGLPVLDHELLCLHQFRSVIDESDEKKIGNTLKVFFLVNCAISFLNLLLAIYHSGSLTRTRFPMPILAIRPAI